MHVSERVPRAATATSICHVHMFCEKPKRSAPSQLLLLSSPPPHTRVVRNTCARMFKTTHLFDTIFNVSFLRRVHCWHSPCFCGFRTQLRFPNRRTARDEWNVLLRRTNAFGSIKSERLPIDRLKVRDGKCEIHLNISITILLDKSMILSAYSSDYSKRFLSIVGSIPIGIILRRIWRPSLRFDSAANSESIWLIACQTRDIQQQQTQIFRFAVVDIRITPKPEASNTKWEFGARVPSRIQTHSSHA